MKINKHTGLRTFDIDWVDSKGPCYPANRFLSENTRYNAITILQDNHIPFQDRLWVVLRTELSSEKLIRLFAVWCARQIPQTHKDCIKALEVAERFANGQAIQEELSAAESAAWSAAESAAWSAAWSAAESAAWSAVRSAAWSAARDAARYAVRSAAWSAAWSPVRSAARDAARSAAESAQEKKLVEMFLAEGKERLLVQAQRKAKKK